MMERQWYSIQNIRFQKRTKYYLDLKIEGSQDDAQVIIERAQYIVSPKQMVNIEDQVTYIRVNVLVDPNGNRYVENAQVFVNKRDVTNVAMLQIRLDDLYITKSELESLLEDQNYVRHAEIADFELVSTVSDDETFETVPEIVLTSAADAASEAVSSINKSSFTTDTDSVIRVTALYGKKEEEDTSSDVSSLSLVPDEEQISEDKLQELVALKVQEALAEMKEPKKKLSVRPKGEVNE